MKMRNMGREVVGLLIALTLLCAAAMTLPACATSQKEEAESAQDAAQAGQDAGQGTDVDVTTQQDASEMKEHWMVENMPFTVDGADPINIKMVHSGYPNNRYASVRDIASALTGTARQFQVEVTEDGTEIATGEAYEAVGGENELFGVYDPILDDQGYLTNKLATNDLVLDGRELRYRTFLGDNLAGQPDLYMSLTDLAMQLDLALTLEDGTLAIDTDGHYAITAEDLGKTVRYHEVHAVLLGDADTGEVLLEHNPDVAFPIASVSKLMTYSVLMHAVEAGTVTPDDVVYFPAKPALQTGTELLHTVTLDDVVTLPIDSILLSRSEDGEIDMLGKFKADFRDLLMGMLLPSSNESAYALAVHAAGDEETFVKWMNQEAEAIGLSEDTEFFNCHGLPAYTDDLPASKYQNHSTARDVFTLARHLLATYPEILEITSLKSAYLKTLDVTVENTNPLLYNVEGVVGLKTGTTDMAGYCLVTCAEVDDSADKTHHLVLVELGGEDATVRATLSEELIRFGMQVLSK